MQALFTNILGFVVKIKIHLGYLKIAGYRKSANKGCRKQNQFCYIFKLFFQTFLLQKLHSLSNKRKRKRQFYAINHCQIIFIRAIKIKIQKGMFRFSKDQRC